MRSGLDCAGLETCRGCTIDPSGDPCGYQSASLVIAGGGVIAIQRLAVAAMLIEGSRVGGGTEML